VGGELMNVCVSWKFRLYPSEGKHVAAEISEFICGFFSKKQVSVTKLSGLRIQRSLGTTQTFP